MCSVVGCCSTGVHQIILFPGYSLSRVRTHLQGYFPAKALTLPYVRRRWKRTRTLISSKPLSAELSVAEEEWIKKIPEKKKPLYCHSLPCIEAWLKKVGFYQSSTDYAVWYIERPDWHARLSLDVTDLYIRILDSPNSPLPTDPRQAHMPPRVVNQLKQRNINYSMLHPDTSQILNLQNLLQLLLILLGLKGFLPEQHNFLHGGTDGHAHDGSSVAFDYPVSGDVQLSAGLAIEELNLLSFLRLATSPQLHLSCSSVFMLRDDIFVTLRKDALSLLFYSRDPG